MMSLKNTKKRVNGLWVFYILLLQSFSLQLKRKTTVTSNLKITPFWQFLKTLRIFRFWKSPNLTRKSRKIYEHMQTKNVKQISKLKTTTGLKIASKIKL